MSRVASLIAIIFLLITCSEEEIGSRSYPRVRTLAVTEINSEGALLRGEITFSSGEIIDHGFVWFPLGPLSGTQTVSLGSRGGKGTFESAIESSLAEGVSYSVKAYAKSANFTVYGEEITFVSLGSKAPKPVKIIPAQGTWGETILIIGENFSTIKNNNTVTFGNRKASIVSVTTDSIKVIVPDSLTTWKSDVSVSFFGNSGKLADAFELERPQIESLSASVANAGEDITINGRYLRSPLDTKVLIGGVQAVIKSLEKTKIVCTVPLGASQDQTTLKVITGDLSLSAEIPFKVNVHTISEITPLLAFFGDVVTIKGEYFVSGATPTVVDFGGVNTTIVNLGPSEIKVNVPYLETPVCKISVTCNNKKITFEEDFKLKPPVITTISPLPLTAGAGDITINGENLAPGKVFLNNTPLTVLSSTATELLVRSPSEPILTSEHIGFIKVVVAQQEAVSTEPMNMSWILLPNYPGVMEGGGVSVVAGDNAYVVGYMAGTAFWQFNGTTRSWKKLSKPAEVSPFGFNFVINDIIYFGSSEDSSLWAYDPSTDTWTRKNDFPFSFTRQYASTGVTLDGKAFVVSIFPQELWQYNDALDEWSLHPSAVPIEDNAISQPRWFVIGEDLYMVNPTQLELWKFSGTSGTWTNLGALPFTPDAFAYFNTSFVIDQYGYIVNSDDGSGTVGLPEIWRFDPAGNHWTKALSYTSDAEYVREPATVFVLNQKAYLVAGSHGRSGQLVQDNGVLEFEPPQE